jgi:hypothetical protein
MPRRLDDITLALVDTKGETLTARLFFPLLGDKGADFWGNRTKEYLEEVPFITLYTSSRRPQRQDPLGNFFFTFSERALRHKILPNGKLRVTPGRARNSQPKRPSRTFAPDQVELLLRFFVDADDHLANVQGLRRERVLARWRARCSLAVRLEPHLRTRPSALAA